MIKWLVRKLIPILQFAGRVHAPWVAKKVDAGDLARVRELIRPGDVLLSRSYGFLTNLLIPGYWKHAAIMGHGDYVIEAVGKGVVKTPLAVFLLTKDEVQLARPRFCDGGTARKAARFAEELLGAKYDYEFSLGNKAFYCAELVYVAYEEAAGEAFGFVPKERLGVVTVTADDYCKAKKWWELFYNTGSGASG